MMRLEDNITSIKGVGEKTATLFNKIHIYTIEDLIKLFPKSYLSYDAPVDISDALVGERVAVRGVINSYVDIIKIRHLKLVSCTVKDYTGILKLTWFNSIFLKQMFHIGQTFIFVGVISVKNGQKVMEHPEYYSIDKYQDLMSKLQPLYPLTEGLTNNTIRKCIKAVLPAMDDIKEYLPQDIIDKYNLLDYKTAVYNMHFPSDMSLFADSRRRMIFDEFFLFLLAMETMRKQYDIVENTHVIDEGEVSDILIKSLPYELTNAQIRTINEIKVDMKSNRAMNRLIQGDVGSGKTIVAMIALLMTVKAFFQAALMVPTEVLAVQHYENFKENLENFGVRVELLIGSTKIKEKRRIYEDLEKGNIDIIIGTHALIQDKVVFKNLGLVITDEQHRFGVNQRKFLSEKGDNPHILVMSATPIPRTLAIIMYGDLDISIIDELPSNRLPIKNCVVGTNYRPTAYKFIEKQVNLGHQVYVICPMVSASDNLEVENVEEYSEILSKSLNSSIRITYLHGKMSPSEKNSIMDEFAKHNIDVLVSTTVIEVGINVPNATVMMIENAERFGLATLHQLRGRVGRGGAQSYCIMMCGKENKESMDRLEILNQSNDGFFIANEDLKLRGAGDFFGIRQSGDVLFNMADIYENADQLKNAKDALDYLVNIDYDINSIKHFELDRKIEMSINI